MASFTTLLTLSILGLHSPGIVITSTSIFVSADRISGSKVLMTCLIMFWLGSLFLLFLFLGRLLGASSCWFRGFSVLVTLA